MELEEESPASFVLSYHEKEGGYFIDDYIGSKNRFSLPENAADGKAIVGISGNAFYQRSVKELALSEKIIHLDDYAFESSGLEKLYVTGHLRDFSDNAFGGVELQKYTKNAVDYFPGIDTPYKYAVGFQMSEWSSFGIFQDKNIYLEDGCEGIAPNVFGTAIPGYYVYLPSSMHTIGEGNFHPGSAGSSRQAVGAQIKDGVSELTLYSLSKYCLYCCTKVQKVTL